MNNEVMQYEGNAMSIAGELDVQNNMFCSITGETKQDKVRIYNAISNPANALSDCKGEILEIKDVIAHYVQMESMEDTGEIITAPRIVLIDKEGATYACVSTGIMQSLKQIFMLFGTPTWEDPVKVKVIEKKGRKGYKFLSLELVA